ncbi:hypothetical protein [Nostoc sp.]
MVEEITCLSGLIFKTGAKFNFLLILVFIVRILGSRIALSSVLQGRAQNEMASQAFLKIFVKSLSIKISPKKLALVI